MMWMVKHDDTYGSCDLAILVDIWFE